MTNVAEVSITVMLWLVGSRVLFIQVGDFSLVESLAFLIWFIISILIIYLLRLRIISKNNFYLSFNEDQLIAYEPIHVLYPRYELYFRWKKHTININDIQSVHVGKSFRKFIFIRYKIGDKSSDVQISADTIKDFDESYRKILH